VHMCAPFEDLPAPRPSFPEAGLAHLIPPGPLLVATVRLAPSQAPPPGSPNRILVHP